tara:strand:- start:2703 stop:3098 length:396 start_codon:yes stop_codon:yes gene_type:complete
MKFFLIIIILFCINLSNADEKIYEAEYIPLKCIGVASEYENMFIAKWTFKPTGGSGSLIDIRYNNKKREGKIRTSVYANGNLYGRGKWIGRTSSRIYNTLVEINYFNETNIFKLSSAFNPDDFHLEGKCSI